MFEIFDKPEDWMLSSYEKILDWRLRKVVDIDKMQYGFI